jgi:replication factor A1
LHATSSNSNNKKNVLSRGNTVDLSLSGMRALEFDGDAVLKIGQTNHIIAIFVGTLMKQYKDGKQFLSGTTACRWYINENDIPAIKAFKRRYAFFV